MLREHPLCNCRLMGRALRYLIASDHGWLGNLGYDSPALYLAARDQWIGWDRPQRQQYLERVLSRHRFLIRPQVHCPNLASQVRGLADQRVPGNFERRYGLRPWLLESFVQTPSYIGGGHQRRRRHHLPGRIQLCRRLDLIRAARVGRPAEHDGVGGRPPVKSDLPFHPGPCQP